MIDKNAATVVPWTALEDAGFDRPPTVALATLLVYLAIIVVIATSTFVDNRRSGCRARFRHCQPYFRARAC